MKKKEYTFKEFKTFVQLRCPSGLAWEKGVYDRKIYNWFDLNKPRKVDFYTKAGKLRKPRI